MGRTSQATRQPHPLTPPCNLHAPAAPTHTLKIPHPGMTPWSGCIGLRLRKRAQKKFVANPWTLQQKAQISSEWSGP